MRALRTEGFFVNDIFVDHIKKRTWLHETLIGEFGPKVQRSGAISFVENGSPRAHVFAGR